MDAFSIFNYEDFDELTITIGEIEYGWMDIILKTRKSQFEYSASYSVDPINDLLESLLLLLTKEPIIVYGDTYWTKDKIVTTKIRKYEVVIHDTESHYIEWVFRFSDNVLTLIIFKDLYSLLDELVYYDFKIADYEKNELEDMPDLTKYFLFAFQGPPIKFAKKLVNLCKEIDSKCNSEEKKLEWGYNYSENNLKKIKDWIIENSD